jgi:hypothetical protein
MEAEKIVDIHFARTPPPPSPVHPCTIFVILKFKMKNDIKRLQKVGDFI